MLWSAVARQQQQPQLFQAFRNFVKQKDWQLRLNVVNSEQLNVRDWMRFDLIWFDLEESWKYGDCQINSLFSHTKPILDEDLNRPFTFQFIHSRRPSIFFFSSTPITSNYIVSNWHNGPLDLCGDFLTSLRLRQSSNLLFFEKKRFSNYPLNDGRAG